METHFEKTLESQVVYQGRVITVTRDTALLEDGTKRELTEECGVYADEYIPLGQIYPTVGYDTEIIYIWAARGLHPAAMHLDADEFLTPERIPLAQAYEMVLSGEIKDAKTVAGILKFKALLDDKKI